MSENNVTDIDLLIIGKTGNGKSALGNSILRRKAFTSCSRVTSVTKAIASEISLFSGKLIKVVDGPGVGDTCMGKEESMEFFTDAMSRAIAANPRGYHAFLLVIRFGGRFTQEDKDTVDFLKNVFSKDFVRDFCILVMTCGDNFEKEFEEEEKSFQDWCSEQEGPFRDLLTEVEGRIVLFDNMTKDEDKKLSQLTELMNVVEHLKFSKRRYTHELFANAQARRDLAMKEAKQLVIQEESFNEMSLIFFEIQQLEDVMRPGVVSRLNDLLKRAKNLYETTKDYDRGEGLFHNFVKNVQRMQDTIQEKIDSVERTKAEEKKREDDLQRSLREELNRLKEDFDRKLEISKLEDERRLQLTERELKIQQLNYQFENEREKSRSLQHAMRQKEIMEQSAKFEEIEKCYREIKSKNEESILEKFFGYVVSAVRSFLKLLK